MKEVMNETISIRQWQLGLLSLVPSVAIIGFFFWMGYWKSEIESRTFNSATQKEDIIDRVMDENTHWNYDKLDTRYMGRNELNYRFETIVKNQEKIMHKLNVN